MLLVIVLVASRWVAEIPTAALAGVLIATAVQMVRVSSLGALLRSSRGDAVVLIGTAAATVLLDLVMAVLLGLVMAGFFVLRQAAGSARLEEVPLDEPTTPTRSRRCSTSTSSPTASTARSSSAPLTTSSSS